MDSRRWERVQELFAAALERPEEDRDRFLEESGADPDVLAEVRSLLEADTDGMSLLDAGAADAADRMGMAEEGNAVGTRIGPWKLVDRIGQGGMGSVYLAERADGQLEQRVALKIIKRGMDSDEILARFRAERQILSRLDHPNIARFLDGGRTDDGVPWFTMEYVDGLPIDLYCEEHALSLDARLDLFAAVCSAVAYAQRNLVVHRDLKPSNVLVTADGTPKLLDFGIAKLLDDSPESAPLPGAAPAALTRTGHRVMTPGYAAPEQVRGEAVTTATDVYALGVILYELLTSQRPYSPADPSVEALERAICHDAPERPSTAVTRPTRDGSGSRPGTGSRTGERPAHLRRRIAGDLDNICLMALRKEPERRYSSAQQLADDIERFRAGHPVSARADTAAYRISKFVRRNRAGVVTAGIVLGVVIGLVTFYTARLTEERDRARLEARKARSVSEFLSGLFEVADPSETQGETVTARELLDRGAARIDSELADQPEVRATMMDVIGNVYLSLGLYGDADSLLQGAARIRRDLHGDEHPDIAASLMHVGTAHRASGRYEESVRALTEAVEMNRRLGLDRDAAQADALSLLAWTLNEQGNYPEAEKSFRAAVDVYEEVSRDATARRDTTLWRDSEAGRLATMNSLGLLLNEIGENAASDSVYRKVIPAQRELLGGVHADLSSSLYNHSQVLRMMDRFDDSEAALREALAIDRKLYGDEHPDVAYDLVSLGRLQLKFYRTAEAEESFREALRIRRKFHGDEHPEVAFSLNDVAQRLYARGEWAEADSLLRASLAMHERVNGPEHPVIADRYRDLGRMAYTRERYEESERHLRRCLDLRERIWGKEHHRYAEACLYLGRTLGKLGRFAEADSILTLGMEITLADRGKETRDYRYHRHGRADVLADAGRYDEAEAAYREVIAGRSEAYGADHPLVAITEAGLARMLRDAGRPEEAAELLRHALSVREREEGIAPMQIAGLRALLGATLCDLGRREEAAELLAAALPELRLRFPDGNRDLRLGEDAWERCGGSVSPSSAPD